MSKRTAVLARNCPTDSAKPVVNSDFGLFLESQLWPVVQMVANKRPRGVVKQFEMAMYVPLRKSGSDRMKETCMIFMMTLWSAGG